MMRRLAPAAFGLLLSIAGLAPGVAGAGDGALFGPPVSPRSMEFSKLPPRTSGVTAAPEERREAHMAQVDSVVAYLKAHPWGPSPVQIGGVTLDRTAGGVSVQAPTVGNGFEGITQGAYIPSEPTVAAGPLNVFTAGNVSVTVTNKDGSSRVETDGQVFFGVPAAEGAISDAQCYYDALRGRFVALCFTQGTSPNFSNFYLAISKTNDARGAWWIYKFDMTKDGSTSTSNWADYPSLGISDDKIALTSQQFTFSGDSYQYQKIRVIDRALAYSGVMVSYVDFANFSAPAGDVNNNFVTKAARNLTAGDNTLHCLCVRAGGGITVTYREVTGAPASPSLSAGVLDTVSTYSVPPDAVQKGSATLVATNDCRPGDFYVRDGVLVCTWHTSASLGGTVSALRLLRLRTSDHVVLTDETYGASGTFYYYPAITVDSLGTLFLGFDRSSSTEFPSAYATGKRRTDATLEPSALLRAGLTSTSQTRWGDYTGIDNDASLAGPGGSTAWYAGQWTKATNVFGTWINRLTFTYGQISGTVSDDCDGLTGTSGDRSGLASVTVTLKQGASTLATTVTDATGAWSFGYLESGTYDVIVTPPAGGSAVDAIPGSGATSQTRISSSDIQVALTNSQTSSGNQFLVTSTHAAPVTSSISPTTKPVGSPAFTLTVNGSGFVRCAVVRLDGSDRTTTWVSANQLTASIPASDMLAGATHTITVFHPAPGGGTSNGQTFTVSGAADVTPPVVTVTAPTGGESWAVGSSHNVTWTATDDQAVTSVDLAYSTDGGTSFPNAIATGIANSGTYSWTVPGTPSMTARVRVVAHDGGGNVGADSSHANFTISGWTITASAGANGTIAPSGAVVVPDGATPAFTITPNTGYSVADVLVDGGSVGAVTGYTFPPVHANHTIAASFAINSYTLTTAVVGSGSVAKSPDQPSYTYGTLVTLTATAGAGYTFAGWSGDATGLTNPITVTMDANKNVTATFTQHIYVWNKTGSAAWGTAANWTPARTTPATDDVLIFSGGGSTAATGVPTLTIAQLVISNGTSVALESSAAATLTIAGGAGTDLDIGAGTTLLLDGTSALTVALAAPATAAIGGTVTVTAAAHRLVALGNGAIVFLNGSLVTAGTGFGGNLFGTGTGTSALNSVVFQSGSIYSQIAGANPFGASAPNSVVTFQAGSRFRLDGALTPSFSGRIYADFEHKIPGATTVTGGSAFRVDRVIVTTGTFNINLTGGGTIRGDITVNSGATLNLNPSASASDTLRGSAPQTITVQGTLTTATTLTLAVNNPNDVTLANDVTLSGPLAFLSGRIVTGANTLGIAATGSVTGAGQGTGWVNGKLRRNFASGSSSRTVDVGDASFYTPVTVAMTGATTAFDVTGATQTPDHPSLASAPLDPARSVNRWWSLIPTGSPTFTSFDATVAWNAADVDAGATPTNFLVERFNGSWFATTIGTRTATSAQASGVTAFGDFAVAEPVSYTLSVTVVGAGTVARAPDQATYAPGTPATLTATPSAGWIFSGWSGDASGSTNPLNLTMDGNRSVTATFADTTRPGVAVLSPNGGDVLAAGSSATLSWSASDNVAVTAVDLLVSHTGAAGPFDPIAAGLANTGSYSWTVTGPATAAAVLEAVAHDAAGNTSTDLSDGTFTISTATAVEGASVTGLELAPVRPNPVRENGRATFALVAASHVRLTVLDLQGRTVAVVADREFGSGWHTLDLELARGTGRPGAGLYFLRLEVPGRTLVRRFVVER